MEFTFTFPIKVDAADGLKVLAAEVEMKADIEVYDSESYAVRALYAASCATQSDWIELSKRSLDYVNVTTFLRCDKATSEKLDARISEELADSVPRRRAVVNEHSTHFGRL